MADADKILKLLVEMGVTGKPEVQAANDLLDETAKTTNKATDATKKVGEESEKASEKFKLFHGEGREMGKVIGEITRISPLLGEALRVAIHPVGGTIAAAIGLFVLMKEHINEVNKELDEMAERAAEPAFLEGIRAKQESLREAAAAAEEYTAHINNLLAGEQGVTAELTAQLALQKAITEARNAQTSAEEALAEAKIKAQVASGKLTPEEGVAAEADAKRKGIADRAQAKDTAQYNEVSAKIAALEKAQGQQPELKANADALTKAFSDEAARRKNTEANFGDAAYDTKKKDADKAIEAAEKKLQADYNGKQIEKYEELIRGFKPGDNSMQKASLEMQLAQMKQFAAPLIDAVEQAKNNRALIEQGRKQFLSDQNNPDAFNDLGGQAAEARKIAEANATAIGALTAELMKLTDAIQATKGPNAAATRAQQDAVTQDEVSGLTKPIAKNREVVKDLREHPDATHIAAAETQKNSAQQAGRALAAAYAKAMKEHNAALAAEFAAALADIAKSNAELIAQIRAARNRPGG